MGNRAVIVVPSSGTLVTSNVPPATVARPRMMAMPKWPSGPGALVSKPRPLSRSSNSIDSTSSLTVIHMSVAWACLRAFITPSRAMW
jgi:hypothetical protein